VSGQSEPGEQETTVMTAEIEAELDRLRREKEELLRFVRDIVAASDEAYDRRGGGNDLYDFGAYWYQQRA